MHENQGIRQIQEHEIDKAKRGATGVVHGEGAHGGTEPAAGEEDGVVPLLMTRHGTGRCTRCAKRLRPKMEDELQRD